MPETLLSDSDLGIGAGESKDNFLTDADLGIQSAPRPTFPMRVPAQTEQYWQPTPKAPVADQMWKAPVLPPMQLDQLATQESQRLKRPPVSLPGGMTGTVRSIGVGNDQGEWVIPTIVDGRPVSNDEAIQLWKQGKNPPIGGPFKTVKEGEQYAQDFHEAEARRIQPPPAPIPPEQIASLGQVVAPGAQPRSTIYGGPRKPLASLAETLVEPTEMLTAPHITIPDIAISENDPAAMVVGKEAINIAKSIPEFFSSDIGVLSLIAGMAAPTAVGAGFTASMLKDLGEEISSTYKNWNEMSRNQKVKAITDIGGTGLMTLLAGTSTAGTLIKPKAGTPVSTTGELPPTALGWQRLKANIEELRGKVAGLPGSRALPIPPIHAPTTAEPAKEVVSGAAYVDPKTGETTVAANHPEAGAEQGVKVPPAQEDRQGPKYKYEVTDQATGQTKIVTPDVAEDTAVKSGQRIEPSKEGERITSSQIESPTQPGVPLSESQVAPKTSEVGPGMGAALAEGEIIEGTALKNAVGELERVGLNLPEAYPTPRHNMARAWIRSGEAEAKSPGLGAKLADDLIANPERNLTDEDSALLLRYKVSLFNEMNAAAEKSHSSDIAVRDGALARHKALSERYTNLLDAVKFRGSEWGREGRWRQAMAKEDYDFSSTDGMNRYHRAKTGKDLTPEQTTKAEKVAGQVKQAVDDLTVARTKLFDAVEGGPTMTVAERRALDAASEAVSKLAIQVAQAENKTRIARTVKETELARIQEDAARKALAKAQDEKSKAAIKLAQAENKARIEQAKTNPLLAQELAAKRALAAADKSASEAAKRLADAENKARLAQVEHQQIIERVQKEAAVKAERARTRGEAQEAIRQANAENRARIEQAKRNKAIADVQVKAAQRALDAANKANTAAVRAAAEAERKNLADPSRRVWAKAKEYLDKGETDFSVIRNKVAADLKMTPDEVFRLIGKTPRIRSLADDLFIKQQNERRLKEQAKRWLTGIEVPLYEKAIKSIPRALFSLRVGFHGWVALGTHAPTVAFQPKFWKVYSQDFVKMYRLVGNPLTGKGQARAAAYYERQVQDLQQRPNYAKARKAGLVNDPFQYEEYHVRGIANPLPSISPKVADWANKFTGMGNRGYAVLKILRQDMFDQMWNSLPSSIQKSDALAAAIADGINHSTGVVKGSAHPGFALALFAPRLEASRAMWIGGDPGRAALTFLRWNRATPEEKFFAKNQVYEKAWVAGTLGSMLALNWGFNQAVGSDQTINVIDPFKSDFLKFKVAGMNVSYGSAMVTMARLPVELAYYAVRPGGKLKNLVYPDEDFSYAIWKFARSQFSPFASLTSDLLFQSDYQGRLLPWSNRPMPKRLRAQGVEPYTWPEFWVEQASPIPFQEAEREIWPAVREIWQGMGMNEEQMRRLGKAWTIWTFMTFTGGRMREDTQSQQPQSYIGPTP